MQSKHKESIGDYIQSFQNGEERGFNFFFTEYYAALAYHSFLILKERSVAEEIAGDALMKLWERHSKFQNISGIKSFLYTTAHNASLNWLRQQRRTNQRTKEFAYFEEKIEFNKFQKTIETETYREIFIALNTLPPKCRQIFKMVFIEGKEYDQIAKELNLSIKTIYSQKDRALMLIRERISLGLWTGFFLHLIN